MTRRVRLVLWVLSSLAVVWTIGAIVMSVWMGSTGVCPMCPMEMGGGMGGGASAQDAPADGGGGMMGGRMREGGMMGGGMMGGGMVWMILAMGLTWVIMLGLDAVFTYLAVTSIRDRRRSDTERFTRAPGA